MNRIARIASTLLPQAARIAQQGVQRAAPDVVQQIARNAASFFSAVAQGGTPQTGPFPGAPEGNPSAGVLLGLQQGASDQPGQPQRVTMLQQDLVRMGYLTMPPGTAHGYFGGVTAEALAAFQRDNGITPSSPPTVDARTVEALRNPRPRPGYGIDAEGNPQQELLVAEAARFYGERLGLPTSGLHRVGDTRVQYFDRGQVVLHDNGRVELLDASGAPMFPAPDFDALRERAGVHHFNQLEGDPDGSNNNCGYASLNMVLSYLGVPGFEVQAGAEGHAANYANTMRLREAGGDGTDDSAWSRAANVYNAAESIDGVSASVFQNTWNGERATDVARMKLAFLDGSQPVAFVVAGNPYTGWGNSGFQGAYSRVRSGDAYNGGHYVAVVGYDPETDRFLVLDPIADRPIEVSSEQMERYMQDQNVSINEVLQVRYDPAS